MPDFPSLRGRQLLQVLARAPLGYRVVRRTGSHRRLEAPGRPPLTFAFHDGQEIPPRTVKKVLTVDVGLTEEEAMGLL